MRHRPHTKKLKTGTGLDHSIRQMWFILCFSKYENTSPGSRNMLFLFQNTKTAQLQILNHTSC